MKVGKIFREDMVNRIKSGVENNENIFILNYSKLSGLQMSEIRKNLKKVDAKMYVSRNAIIQKAFESFELDKLTQKLDGATAVIWSNADSVEVSKILVKFTKDFEGVALRGGKSGKELLDEAKIKQLSDLPSKDVLRAQLLGTIQAPLTRLLGAFNAKSRELLSILKQLSEKKGGQ